MIFGQTKSIPSVPKMRPDVPDFGPDQGVFGTRTRKIERYSRLREIQPLNQITERNIINDCKENN